MSNQNKAEFSGVIIDASSDLSLEERVTALEKQLDIVNQAVAYIQEANSIAMSELRSLVTLRASADKIEESLHQSIKKTKG